MPPRTLIWNSESYSPRPAKGAGTWLRIIVAIGTLGTPPTDSRHRHRASTFAYCVEARPAL
jgi:hypothetical protein